MTIRQQYPHLSDILEMSMTKYFPMIDEHSPNRWNHIRVPPIFHFRDNKLTSLVIKQKIPRCPKCSESILIDNYVLGFKRVGVNSQLLIESRALYEIIRTCHISRIKSVSSEISEIEKNQINNELDSSVSLLTRKDGFYK